MVLSNLDPFMTAWHGLLNISIYVTNQKKKEIIILKLDFEKAFDKVEYSAILDMLKHLGFGDKFGNWVREILYSASTSVLLNGVPGKPIKCKRGVRQGDPLSPILYVLAGELLQYVINKAWTDGDIQLPLANYFGLDYPIIQYVDDTLIIMPAKIDQLQNLKNILQRFSLSTGLKVNYSKSSIIIIN